MVHILLLILKIIGIILLTVLALCLLILFFPVTYKVKGDFSGKRFCISVKCGWLFHLLHFGGGFSNEINIAKIRILGIPINLLKEEAKFEKKTNPKKDKDENQTKEPDNKGNFDNVHGKEDSKEQPESAKEKKSVIDKIKDLFKKILYFFRKTKETINKTFKDIKGAYNKAKEVKAFITANTTKEAYRYGKRIVIKVIKHIFPKKIRAKIHFGFEQPDATGKMLGYIAMVFSTFHVNVKHVSVIPDFDKKIIEGNIKLKGRFFIGVLLIDGLRFYFKKEIHDIIKRFK